MRRRLSGLLILLFLAIPSRSGAQDGTLQRVREEVNADRKDDVRRDDPNRCSQDSEDWFGGAGAEFLGAVLTLPFWLPYRTLGDDYDRIPGLLTCPPYADPGQMEQFWGIRLSLEESNDFQGLNRVNGRLYLDTILRVGIETGWSWLHERLDDRRRDEMVLGDANLVFRFAQSEHWQFRTGLGARFLADRGDSRFGFNFTYGADCFPAKPFLFSGVIDLGTLGSAGVFHGRLTGGVTHSGWEIFAGYDCLRIGSVNLQGPVVGVRLWF